MEAVEAVEADAVEAEAEAKAEKQAGGRAARRRERRDTAREGVVVGSSHTVWSCVAVLALVFAVGTVFHLSTE